MNAATRAPVAVEKQNLERGAYQLPDLYHGQSPQTGMNYVATREPPKPARDEPVAADA